MTTIDRARAERMPSATAPAMTPAPIPARESSTNYLQRQTVWGYSFQGAGSTSAIPSRKRTTTTRSRISMGTPPVRAGTSTSWSPTWRRIFPRPSGRSGRTTSPSVPRNDFRRGGARRRTAPERAEEGRHARPDDEAEDDGDRDVDADAHAEKGERRSGHSECAEGVGPEAEGEEVGEEGAVVGVAVSFTVSVGVAVAGIVSAPVSLENGRADEDEAEGQRREVDGQHGGDNLHRAGPGGGRKRMVGTGIESVKGMEDDDARLLEGIRRGDGESARILYDRTRGFLLDAVIRPRVGSADAEDVLSETWLRAVERLRGFEWRGIGLLHWLSAIARRTALERLRRVHREEVVPDLAEIFGDVPDGAPSAEADMIAAERLRRMRERVAATLAELPRRHADALSLRLLEGRERTECAEAFGISIGAFDVLLHRAARGFARRWSQP